MNRKSILERCAFALRFALALFVVATTMAVACPQPEKEIPTPPDPGGVTKSESRVTFESRTATGIYFNDKTSITYDEAGFQQAFNHNTFMLCRIASGDCISILLDESGGKGIEAPFRMPSYLHNVHVGFAGGINPDNVVAKVQEITSLPHVNRFWIDMESGVRTNDRFDLDKVEQVCELVYEKFLIERA